MKLLSVLNYVSKAKPLNNVKQLAVKVVDPEKQRKAELAKKLNKENKLLFGPVIKTKKKTSNTEVRVASVKNNEEQEKSSEYYWLFHHKSENPKSDKLSNDVQREYSKTEPPNKEINAKESQSSEVSTVNIPFTTKGIQQMFKFPLVLNNVTNLIEYCADFNGAIPSVGKVLSSTMPEASRKALIDWKISKIQELGEEGFNKMQQEHLRKGKELHSALENFLKTQIEPESNTDVFNTWKSVTPILTELKPKAELIESWVQHPFLKYKGVVDCVSYVGSDLTVIEWKKSDKPKTTAQRTYDAPLQLAAYLGALNSDPKYKFSIKTGYVAVAYTNGKPGNLFKFNEVEMQNYWQLWLQRLQEYWVRTRDNTLPEPI